MGTRTKQQMVHVNDSHLGLRSHPLSHVSCLAAMELGTGAVMANGGVTAAFSRLTGRVGVGEAEKRERGEGQSAGMLPVETGRGVVCGLLVVWLFGAVRSHFEVQDGFGVGLGRALCAAVTQGRQSVILTAASVDYCLEVIILGNRMKKKVLLTFYRCFWETWSGEAGRT